MFDTICQCPLCQRHSAYHEYTTMDDQGINWKVYRCSFCFYVEKQKMQHSDKGYVMMKSRVAHSKHR